MDEKRREDRKKFQALGRSRRYLSLDVGFERLKDIVIGNRDAGIELDL